MYIKFIAGPPVQWPSEMTVDRVQWPSEMTVDRVQWPSEMTVDRTRNNFCKNDFCNNEGKCSYEDERKVCKCNEYFTGDTCDIMVDHCQTNPCANNENCKTFPGQFICVCQQGFGGRKCDFKNVFTSMLLHFNHYAIFGEMHDFLITIETLGEMDFSLELTSANYAIEALETKMNEKEGLQSKWTHSEDLERVVKNMGLKNYNGLPYMKGYYRKSKQTFWTGGRIEITLLAYDSETGQQMFFDNVFPLDVIKPAKIGCTPLLEFLHCSNPSDPLEVDIAHFNNFEPVIKKKCYKESILLYYWKIYNSIGTVQLFDFGYTEQPLLKVSPYKLWFHYAGEVMSSYRIEVHTIEKFKKVQVMNRNRCFIRVAPKPVFARIAGGEEREVGAKQPFILDGSKSRDFALDPESLQDMSYVWSCTPDDDTYNEECVTDMGSGAQLLVKGFGLQLSKKYTFHLKVTSIVNIYMSHIAQQKVTVVETKQLFIDIECVRNCVRNEYIVDRFIHLRAQCSNCRTSVFCTYKWFLNGNLLDEGKEERLIYTPKTADIQLQFVIEVLCGDQPGKGNLKMTPNEPPKNGACAVKPNDGVAFETDFEISCENYEDLDLPLNYQFIAGDYPLDRTNDPMTRVRLPISDTITVIVCDQFEACTEVQLKVTIQPLSDIKKYLSTEERVLGKLFQDYDMPTALVLIKTLAASLNDAEIADMMIEEMGDVDLHTLLRVEQMITITKELSHSLKPLNNKKSLIFSKYFQKLYKGFDNIFKDKEVRELSESPYEKASQELLDLLKDFSQAWENIPKVQVLEIKSTTSDDPLAEEYEEFPDFDVTALVRIENWLYSADKLFKCITGIGLAAVNMHEPAEDPFTIESDLMKYQVRAIDLIKENLIEIKEDTMDLQISNKTLDELHNQLKGQKAIMQFGLLKQNPFWWYPDNYGIDTDIIHFAIFGKESNLKKLIELENPLELKINLNKPDVTPEPKTITGYIKHYLHMPVFTVEVPGHSVLSVTFLETTTDLMFRLKVDKPPRSYEVQNSENIVSTDTATKKQTFFIRNTWDNTRPIYFAVRTVNKIKEKSSFSFIAQVQQCVMWDFEQEDPQWSSLSCKTIPLNQEQIACHCYHLSMFSGKSYSTVANEDLDDRILLEHLGFNWFILSFYIILLMFYWFILLYATFRCKRHKQILITNVDNSFYDIQVSIFTGGHVNSSSTANITFRFLSESGPYNVTIYQHPDKPLLRQNTITKVYLSSVYVKFPTKLLITQDQSGRFPTWYCKKIIMENFSTKEKQIFQIDRWISQHTIDINPGENDRTWRQRYYATLSLIYKNWYLFQPFLGPVLYEDLLLTSRTYNDEHSISITVETTFLRWNNTFPAVSFCLIRNRSTVPIQKYVREQNIPFTSVESAYVKTLQEYIFSNPNNMQLKTMSCEGLNSTCGVDILQARKKLFPSSCEDFMFNVSYLNKPYKNKSQYCDVPGLECINDAQISAKTKKYVIENSACYPSCVEQLITLVGSDQLYKRAADEMFFVNINIANLPSVRYSRVVTSTYLDLLFPSSCEDFMFNVSYLNKPYKSCEEVFKFHELEMGYCYLANNLIDAASYEDLPLKYGFNDNDYSLKLYLKGGFIWKYEMYITSPENLPYFDAVAHDVFSDPTIYRFNIEEYRNDVDVRYESIQSRSCKFPDERDEGSPWHYSTSTCMSYLRIQRELEECNCTHFTSPEQCNQLYRYYYETICVGGIIGLFVGISAINILELFYWCLCRRN
uniref:EGF-like domain-containing protein n=1 Tax=Glossina brevipalpis TaxID=37001 RepID=A0A1A9WF38_9MUSC